MPRGGRSITIAHACCPAWRARPSGCAPNGLGLITRLLTGAGTPRELHARGSAYLFCVILPDAALLAIIAFADEHPIAILAITFEADPVS